MTRPWESSTAPPQHNFANQSECGLTNHTLPQVNRTISVLFCTSGLPLVVESAGLNHPSGLKGVLITTAARLLVPRTYQSD